MELDYFMSDFWQIYYWFFKIEDAVPFITPLIVTVIIIWAVSKSKKEKQCLADVQRNYYLYAVKGIRCKGKDLVIMSSDPQNLVVKLTYYIDGFEHQGFLDKRHFVSVQDIELLRDENGWFDLLVLPENLEQFCFLDYRDRIVYKKAALNAGKPYKMPAGEKAVITIGLFFAVMSVVAIIAAIWFVLVYMPDHCGGAMTLFFH